MTARASSFLPSTKSTSPCVVAFHPFNRAGPSPVKPALGQPRGDWPCIRFSQSCSASHMCRRVLRMELKLLGCVSSHCSGVSFCNTGIKRWLAHWWYRTNCSSKGVGCAVSFMVVAFINKPGLSFALHNESS